MNDYTAKDVAKMLDLSVEQVRSFARAGFLDPDRGEHGEYLFSFQDLVLLRTAKGLTAENLSSIKVRNALVRIKQMLPQGQPLSGVQLLAEGDQIVVRQGDSIWSPDSGQRSLNFGSTDTDNAVSIHSRNSDDTALDSDPAGIDLNAEEWFGLGLDLEEAAPDHAREAYRRTLEFSPNHVTARVHLGRLLQRAGHLVAADAHYVLALGIQPHHAVGSFYRGTLLEESGRVEEAIAAFRATIEQNPSCAEAYLRLGRLHERLGEIDRAKLFRDAHAELTAED